MRIAVLDQDRCKPKDCNFLCMRICPMVRTGSETIVVNEDIGKPEIAEALCTGCGICPKKCPYDAIIIVNVPEEAGEPVHQYGVNGFRLYNLPTPRQGVVGIVGANGIGKTTILKILSGEITPNLGGGDVTEQEILDRFRGHEIQGHFKKLFGGEVKASYKPQYVDAIPKHVKGRTDRVLRRGDENGTLDELFLKLDLGDALEKKVTELSGGELQRMAICAALSKDADIYLLDEPSSYLDVRERLNVAQVVRNLKDKIVFVVEHDLVVTDYLSDHIHVLFGVPGAYGIVSSIKGVRVGINEYLGGFLKTENMRFRDEIKFHVAPPSSGKSRGKVVSYPDLVKDYGSFHLEVAAGSLVQPEVKGVIGPNASGKTTFIKLLAGVEEPDNTKLTEKIKVSYKPQYIQPGRTKVATLGLKAELVQTFRLAPLMDRFVRELSGGELQRVAVADCLSKKADVYLLDEPSAYLDVEERLALAKYLRRFVSEKKTSLLVVDHDILLIDYLSDKLMVFEGEPGKSGKAGSPVDLRKGMNQFLVQMDTTFRRDPDTGRPRANKPDSIKDREQKQKGEYYYTGK
ncbi:MAG: ribosome biogenesis/translation initiation ATPase RLI [Candidatus Altiarchaeota archaeon]